LLHVSISLLYWEDKKLVFSNIKEYFIKRLEPEAYVLSHKGREWERGREGEREIARVGPTNFKTAFDSMAYKKVSFKRRRRNYQRFTFLFVEDAKEEKKQGEQKMFNGRP